MEGSLRWKGRADNYSVCSVDMLHLRGTGPGEQGSLRSLYDL